MFVIAVIVFTIFIFMAHIFAPQGYSWTAETVSRLADPGHPFAWILRTGMIFYGTILIAATPDISFPPVLISVYGFGVIITGIFTGVKYKLIHMFSIYTAGAALTVAMFLLALTGSLISIICLVIMITAELLFNIKPLARWRGLSQRVVHLSSFIWLIVIGASL